MPWFSYHGGHSGQFCRHAQGALAAVVEGAYAAGFTTYGLSEHCPRWRARDLYPDESGMTPEDLVRDFEAYIHAASALRDAWAGRMEVLVGFETEVVPSSRWPQAMRELRSAVGCDYIIGSVHHVGDTCIDYDAETTARLAEELGGRDALHERYFELVAQVADELRPEVIGHIDLIRKFDGHDPEFGPRAVAALDRALDAIAAAGSALDVNAAPARRGVGPVYPLVWILERARARSIPVTLGDDSHGPEDVGVGLEHCVQAIASAGYSEIHYLTRSEDRVTLVAAPIDAVSPSPR